MIQFLVATEDHYWGKGDTIEEAFENANITTTWVKGYVLIWDDNIFGVDVDLVTGGYTYYEVEDHADNGYSMTQMRGELRCGRGKSKKAWLKIDSVELVQ